jgi:uncharacterized protein (DUF1778 family)
MQPLGAEDTRSDRIELRVTPKEKALLLRAAEIAHLDMNSFVMLTTLSAAQEVIERTEHGTLQMQQAVDDNSQNTGKDLIAFFRASPLADVAVELERDKATSRTITF